MERETGMEYSVNLCELTKQIKQSGRTVVEVVEETKVQNGWDHVERIYIGSYFCSHYFLSLAEKEIMEICNLAVQEGYKVTLVLPIFTEKSLGRAKKMLDRLSCKINVAVDEITVNDYGMLVYIASKYRVKINLGRMFMKDYRDPRYPEYFAKTLSPAGFTSSLVNFIKKYRVHMVEVDPTHAVIDLSNKPDKVGVAVHSPFCYMTTGQICEYASIDVPVERKFRPNMECQVECTSHHIEYEIENMEHPRKFVRLGRTIYFKNEECKVTGINGYRIIAFPLEA